MCSSNHQRLLDGLPVENFDVAAMWVLGFGLSSHEYISTVYHRHHLSYSGSQFVESLA